jgi:3D (Asp-Asp-Asp) domain-containing protein
MKNLVRGGFLLMLLSLCVAIIYAQTRSDETLSIAKDSQPKLNNTEVVSNTGNTNNHDDTDKKLVKTTGLVTSAKAGLNKGSFSATAYCLQGRTAMGASVRRGIIAADPRVLRMGSKVMITGGGYSGVYTVSDTGGGIRGRELDIWVPSCSEARRFGRRSVNVLLLPN